MLSVEQIKRVGKHIALYKPLSEDQRAYFKSQAAIQWMFGGNLCLGGEQLIYDPVEKIEKEVSSIDKPFHVYAFDGQKKVIAKADKPFKKTPAQLYELKLSNGQSIVCSANHLVLDSFCNWTSISQLQPTSFLFQPSSISGNDPLVPCEDVLHLNEKAQDLQDGYHFLSHFCDGQFRISLSNGQEKVPLSSDVQGHTSCLAFWHKDAPDNRQRHSRLYRLFDLLSKIGIQARNADRFFGTLCHAFCKLYELTLHQLQVYCQSMPEFCPQQSIGGLNRLGNHNISVVGHDHEQDAYVSCNSPKLKSNDSIAVISLDVKRFDDIWDFNVPIYHNYLSGGVIHHNSGKTYTNMMDLAQLALNIHPFKQAKGIHWVGIETWEQVRDILWEQYLQKFIPQHHIIDIRYGQDKVPRKIYLNTGNTIEFKAFNQGRTLFQGRAIKSAHYDEQCLHDFEGILHETQARLITYQGYLSWSMTPIMPQTFLEERIEELPATDEIFHFNLNDNRKSRGGFIEDQRIDNMIAEWPDGVQATRIEGKFASYYGAVYKNFNRSIHVIKPFRIPDGWTLYRGIDFGFTNPFVCYDKETEILTNEGWKLFANLNKKEKVATIDPLSKIIKYQKPVKYIKQRYKGKMLISTPRVESANFCVTPNHKMVVVDRRKPKKWKFVPAEKLSCYDIPVGWNTISAKKTVDFIVPHGKRSKTILSPVNKTAFAEFVGLWLADGSLLKGKAGWFVRIAQKTKCKEVERILNNLGWKYTTAISDNRVKDYRIQSKDLWSWFLNNTKWSPNKNKNIPREIYSWGRDELENLVKGHLMGDGVSDRNRMQHFSTCKNLIDDLQEVYALLGKSTTIKTSKTAGYSGMRDYYILTICKAKLAAVQKMKIMSIDYNDMIFCVEVPKYNTLVVRRRGRPMVCGNCLWLAKDKDENWYVYREYYRAKTGIQEHIANIKARSSNEKYQGTYADPENAEDRGELRKAGIPTLIARNDVARGIELVQSKLKVKANGKPSLYIFKSCRNTAREMAMYQYPKGSASRDPKDLPLAKNDHTLDVVRYILYTVDRPRKKGSVSA